MTSDERFLPGSVYFIVLHIDEALTLPVVQTLIFVEKATRKNGGIEYRFREIGPRNEETLFVVKEEHADELVVDRKGLIERLSK